MPVYNIALSQDFFREFLLGFHRHIPQNEITNTLVLLPSIRACKKLDKYFGSARPKIFPLGSVEDFFPILSSDKVEILSPSELKLLVIEFLTTRAKISYPDSLEISDEIINFISKFERDEIPLSKIKEVYLGDVPDRARYIFSALELIAKDWSGFLAQKNRMTETQRRNNFIRQLLERWQDQIPRVNIIIAGSFGTFSSTRKLMKAVANLDKGYVILHGAENLRTLEHPIDEVHPCYQVKRIFQYLSCDNIGYWGDYCDNNQALASLTKFLVGIASPQNENLKSETSFYYQECTSVSEEIKVIVDKVCLWKKDGIKNIGIVTNDRVLSSRLIQSLELHDILVETNNVSSIMETEQISFILAIYRAWKDKFSPLSLLTLISHDLFLLNDYDKSQVLGKLEIDYLRGVRRYKNLDELIAICRDDQNEGAAFLLQRILDSAIIENLDQSLTCKYILQQLINAAAFLSDSSVGEGEQGQRCLKVLDKLLEHFADININIEFFENTLIKLLEGQRSRDLQQNAIVSILSSIESRLLRFEYLILAGMNESSWGSSTDIDPFLGAVLYEQLGIDSYKIKIGQSANDFIFLLQNKNLLITRSQNQNNSPHRPYRFLDKINIWVKKNNLTEIEQPVFVERKNLGIDIYKRPIPKPPVSLRPKKLSVTQIEKLVRDPYSIYASLVLRLTPLQPLDKKPGNLEFGNLIHHVLNIFNKTCHTLKSSDYYINIMKIGNMLLSQIPYSAYVDKIWRPRFARIASWVAQYEQSVRKSRDVSTELKVSGDVGGCTITAKVDRLEKESDKIRVIDFKTGSLPTKEDVITGFSPQLPLEALLISNAGQYNKIEISYIKLGAGDNIGKSVNIPLDNILTTYGEGISNLLNHYANADTPYLVSPVANKSPVYNEYEHLERRGETNLF